MITPKTKISDLLEEYPALEEVLFEISPAFRQLKNPVLRRTVARVTTLQQAAIVGGLKVEELVNRLRSAAGVIETHNAETHDYASLQTSVDLGIGRPEWFDMGKVTARLDAREMLNRGEHPVAQVLAKLKNLPEGSIYELTAPFNPAPLIEKAAGLGFTHWIDQVEEEEFRVYFHKKS
jgi:uncharacterized protein (DUF2249 family)